MTIYYFGDFDPGYARNRVLICGLQENGINVVLYNDRAADWSSRLRLVRKICANKNPGDRIIVGYSDSRWAVPLLRLFGCGPIIWDAFYSIYDSFIYDRKLAGPRSLKALWYWSLDWLSCRLSQKVLLDTQAHISYFVQTFGVNTQKFIRVFVGSDDSLFSRPQTMNTQKPPQVSVRFWGKFIPLQGIEYIVRAAKILEDDHRIRFKILGNGQVHSKITELLRETKATNIDLIDRVPLKELPSFIAAADICLGIFGNTAKAERVIPNKVYESMAMRKAIITSDTPAARELLVDGRHVIFAKVADASDLAEKIKSLAGNETLRNSLADAAYALFRERLTPKSLAADLLAGINSKHE